MCIECHNAMQTGLRSRGWTPTDEEIMDFLWSSTCFPCGDGSQVSRQIHEAFDRFGSLPTFAEFSGAAAAHANAETEAAMREFRQRYPDE